jgi:exodeoxyribonuclease-3
MEILMTEESGILFLQETKVNDEEFPQALIKFAIGRGYQVYFRGQKQQRGVALFTKHKPQRITFEIEGASSVTAFRYIETTIMGLTIIGIYAPQGQQFNSIHYRRKQEFCNTLHQRVCALQNNGHVVMIMGDFNIIPADVDMYNPGHPYHDTNASASEEERGWLDRFVKAGFIDLFEQ